MRYFEKLKGDIGLFSRLFFIIPQLTSRKLANNALRISEAKYRCLFESIAQSVMYLDAAGVVISANQAVEQLLGLARDNIIGRKFLVPFLKLSRKTVRFSRRNNSLRYWHCAPASLWRIWLWGCLMPSGKVISGLL